MDDIDFLPEAYRKKCQQRHWIMRRVHISVFVACIMTVFIGYDQHSIRSRRLQIIPKLQHQLVTLENSKLQHENVQKQLRESTFKRERLFLPLLRVSRSRLVGEVLHRLPKGASLNTVSLVTQPELWVGSRLGVPKNEDRIRFELKRLVEIATSSELKLSLAGSAQSMDQINEYAKGLSETQLFANIKLQETRRNGDRFEFNLLAIVVNPYLMDEKSTNGGTQPIAEIDLQPNMDSRPKTSRGKISNASFETLKAGKTNKTQLSQ